jgi:hypothetical protein
MKKKDLFSGVVTQERVVVDLPRQMKDNKGNTYTQLTLIPVKASGNAFLKQATNRGGSIYKTFIDFINEHVEEDVDLNTLNLTTREVDMLLVQLHELSYGKVLWQLLACDNEQCKNHRGFKVPTYINLEEGKATDLFDGDATKWLINTVSNDGEKFVQFLESTTVMFKTDAYVITGCDVTQVTAKEAELYQDVFSKNDIAPLKRLFKGKIKHLLGYKITELDTLLQTSYENDYPGLIPQSEDNGTYKGKRAHYKNVLVPVELLTGAQNLDEVVDGFTATFTDDVLRKVSTVPLLIQHCFFDVTGLFVRTVTECPECKSKVDFPALNHAGICNPVLGLDTTE